jgi:uncharacterized DUF497 family protein
VRYEWDEAKNRRNQREHDGISFKLAALVFEETNAASWVWTVAHIEPEAAVLLLVVHAYREDCHGEEIIRIISARRAEKHEIRRYQEQAME